MEAEHNQVTLGPEKWDGLWRNQHWLMSSFARHSRVLYIEPHRALRPTLAHWRAGHLSLTSWNWKPGSHLDAGLYLYHQPPFAPVTSVPVLGPTTRGMRRRLLSGAAARPGLQRPIVWISRPWMAPLARSLEACLTIYDVVDEYSAYPGQTEAERTRVRLGEEPILRRAGPQPEPPGGLKREPAGDPAL